MADAAATPQPPAQPPSQALRQIASIAAPAGAAAGAAVAAAAGHAPSMGLTGLFAQVANFGAVAFVCVMFWFQMQTASQTARDDRVVFRDAIQSLRDDFRQDSNRQWQAIREVAESNRKLAESVERLVRDKD